MAYLKNNFNGKVGKPKTRFKVKRIENSLIFFFQAEQSSLYSYSNKDNDDIWKGCAVVVFLDLGDDFYYEFEVAPNGATFVATIKDRKITFIDNDFFHADVEIKNDEYFAIMYVDLNKLNISSDIKFNAFRIEMEEGQDQQLFALNPTLCGTFHVREKFIKL